MCVFIQVMNYTIVLTGELVSMKDISFSFCDLLTACCVPQALKLFLHYHSFFITKYFRV